MKFTKSNKKLKTICNLYECLPSIGAKPPPQPPPNRPPNAQTQFVGVVYRSPKMLTMQMTK